MSETQTEYDALFTRKTYHNRRDWLNARGATLGASEASAAVGASPYKTNVRLWQEKTGRAHQEDIGDKPCVLFGSEAEQIIRDMFTLENRDNFMVYYQQYEILTSVKYPWMSASLDGEILRNDEQSRGVLEIKTSTIKSAAMAGEWQSGVPKMYLVQVLHQLIVTGYPFAILRAHIIDRYKNRVSYDNEYLFKASNYADEIQWLIQKEFDFWECVKLGKRPATILPEI